MRFFSIIKPFTKTISLFIPNTVSARIASQLAILAVESLVKNSKTKVDDKGLEIVKKIVCEQLPNNVINIEKTSKRKYKRNTKK